MPYTVVATNSQATGTMSTLSTEPARSIAKRPATWADCSSGPR